MNVPKEIYEIIDYINEQKHPAQTKELFFALAERGIEQSDNSLKSADLLGGEGFALHENFAGFAVFVYNRQVVTVT